MNNSKFSFGKSQSKTTDEENGKGNNERNKKNKYESKFLNSGTKTGVGGIGGIKKAIAIGLAAASTITLGGDAYATVFKLNGGDGGIVWNGGEGKYKAEDNVRWVEGQNTAAAMDGTDTLEIQTTNTATITMNAGNHFTLAEVKNINVNNGVLSVGGADANTILTVKKVTTGAAGVGKNLDFEVDTAKLFLDLTDSTQAGALDVTITGNANINLNPGNAGTLRIKGHAAAANAKTITFTQGIDSTNAGGAGVLIIDDTGAAGNDVGAIIFQGQVGGTNAVAIKIGGTDGAVVVGGAPAAAAVLQFDTDGNDVKTAGVTFYSKDAKLIIKKTESKSVNGAITSEAGVVVNTAGGGGILELEVDYAGGAKTITVTNEIGNAGAGIYGINLKGNHNASKVIFSESVALGGKGNNNGVGAGYDGSAGFLDAKIALTELAVGKNISIGGDGGNATAGDAAGGDGGTGTVKFYDTNAMELKLGDNTGGSKFQIGGKGGDGNGNAAGGNGGNATFTLTGNALTIAGDEVGTELKFGGDGGAPEGGANGGNGGAGGTATLDLGNVLSINDGGNTAWKGYLGGTGANGSAGVAAGGKGGDGGNGGNVTITSNNDAAALTETTNGGRHTKFTFGGKGGNGNAGGAAGNAGGDGGVGGDFEIDLKNNFTVTLVANDRAFGGKGGNGGNSNGAGADGAGGKGGNFKLTFGAGKAFIVAGQVATLGGTGGTGGVTGLGNGASGGNAFIIGANNAGSILNLVAASIIGGTGGAGANNGNGGSGGIGALELKGTNAAAGNTFAVSNDLTAIGGTGGAGNGNGAGGAGGTGVIVLSAGNASTIALNADTTIGGKAGAAGGGGGAGGAGGAGCLVGSNNGINQDTGVVTLASLEKTTHALSSNRTIKLGNDGANGNGTGVGGAGGAGYAYLGANFTTSANGGVLVIGGNGGAGTGGAGSHGGAGGDGILRSDGNVTMAINGAAVTIGGNGGAGGGAGGDTNGGAGGAGTIEVNSGTLTINKAVTLGGNGGAKANGGTNGNGGTGTISITDGGAIFNGVVTLGGASGGVGANVGASIIEIKKGTVEFQNTLTAKGINTSVITLGDAGAGNDGTLKLTTFVGNRDLKEFKGGILFSSVDSAIQYKADANNRSIILPTITTGADNTPRGTLEIGVNGNKTITVTSASAAGAADQEFAIGVYGGAAGTERSLKKITIKNFNDNKGTVTFVNNNADGTINSESYYLDHTGINDAANNLSLVFKANDANALTVVGNVKTSTDGRGILSLTSANDTGVVNFIGNVGEKNTKLNGVTIQTNAANTSKVSITGSVYAGNDGIKINGGGGGAHGLVTFKANGANTEIYGNINQDTNNYNLEFDTLSNNTITVFGSIADGGAPVLISNTGGANANAKVIFKNTSVSATKIDNGATLEINPGVGGIAAFGAIGASNANNGTLIIDTSTAPFTSVNAIGGGGNALNKLKLTGSKAINLVAVTLGGAGATLDVDGTGDYTFGNTLTIGDGANAGKLLVKQGTVIITTAAAAAPITLSNHADSGIKIGDGAKNATVSITANNVNTEIGGAATTNPVVLKGNGYNKFYYGITGHNAATMLKFGNGGANKSGIYAEDQNNNSKFEVFNNTADSAGVLTIDGVVGYKGNDDLRAIKYFVAKGQSNQNSIVDTKGDVNVRNLEVEKATFRPYNGGNDQKVISETIYGTGAIEVRDGELKNPDSTKQVQLGGFIDSTIGITEPRALNTIKFVNTIDRDSDNLYFKDVTNVEYDSDKKLKLTIPTIENIVAINFTRLSGGIIINGITTIGTVSPTIGSLVSTNNTMGNFTITNINDKLVIKNVGTSKDKRFGVFNIEGDSQFTSQSFFVKDVNVLGEKAALIAGSFRGLITNLAVDDKSTLNVGTTGYDVNNFTTNSDFKIGVKIGGVSGATISTGRLKIIDNANVSGNVTDISLSAAGDTTVQRDIFTKISLNSKGGTVAVKSDPIFIVDPKITEIEAFKKQIEVKQTQINVLSTTYDPDTKTLTTRVDPKKVDEAAKKQAESTNNSTRDISEELRQEIIENTSISEIKLDALSGMDIKSDEFKILNELFIVSPTSTGGQLGALLQQLDVRDQVKAVKIKELLASIDLDQIAEQVTGATTTQINDRVSQTLDSAISDDVANNLFDSGGVASSPIEAKYSASGDDGAQRTGLWMKAFLGSGEKKKDVSISGFKSDIKGVTIGVDTTATDRLIVGGAITFAGTNMKMKDGIRDGDKVSTNSKVFSIYGSYALGNNVFFSLVGSYGSNTTEIKEDRGTIEGFDSGERKQAKSEYGSNMYSLSTKLMYKHVADNLILTPSVGLNFSRANDEGYSEKNIDTAKTYDSKYMTRVNLVGGVKAAYNFGNIVPEVHVNLTQKVAGKDPKNGYKLDGFGDFRYSENTKKLAATSYNVGGSINYKTDSINVGVGVDGNFASKYKGYQGSLNLRINM